jgi:Ankyrin repeat
MCGVTGRLGAAMTNSLGIGATALVLALSAAALSQEQTSSVGVAIAANTIASIPPIASAVLSGDRERLAKAVSEFKNVNDQVHGKDGARAGYTPLILAAAVSDRDTAQFLISKGADITILDDFHRSALWYAAVRDNAGITATLVGAPGAGQVINAAECGSEARASAHCGAWRRSWCRDSLVEVWSFDRTERRFGVYPD